jgi:Myb-like DNA-binding domain
VDWIAGRSIKFLSMLQLFMMNGSHGEQYIAHGAGQYGVSCATRLSTPSLFSAVAGEGVLRTPIDGFTAVKLPSPKVQKYHRHLLPSVQMLSPEQLQMQQSQYDEEIRADEKRPPAKAKAVFMDEDDALLVKLKDRGLTWRQIARHFPGRTAGTLQVRYCTKLRRRHGPWTKDMVCCVL